MDAGTWGAIGGGLTALSEGLTAMQLRKLAKEREDEERRQQKEEAALRKAQLKAQEFQSMDTRNFKKVSENGQVTNKANANALLNAAAFGRGGEQVKGDISGDTYFRGEGESPNDQRRAIEDERLKNALDKITLQKDKDAEIARIRAQAELDKKAMLGGDTKYRVDGQKSIAASRPVPVGRGGSGTPVPKDRTTTIMQYAKQLATPRFNRETMEDEPGMPWEQAVEQAKYLVDKAAGGGTAAPVTRKATDQDVLDAIKAVGNDPNKVRAWLKAKGIAE